MTEIYVIITETCYIQSQTNKGTSNHKALVTTSENGCDMPIVFASVENAQEYLESKGFMIDTDLIRYRFKNGNATQTDLELIANKVKERALVKGKDIVIENLNFKDTKAKTVSKRDKKYNNMLHSLAYRKFTNIIENVCYRNCIWLRKVNPAWTSWIAKQKYCPQMKLNIHTGASFVIARRGQGYTEKV